MRAISSKTIFTNTLSVAGIILSVLTVSETAHADGYRHACQAYTAVDTAGRRNEVIADVSGCAELNVYQRNNYNRSDIEVNGGSRVAVGQFGGSEFNAVIDGEEHDIGAIQSRGGRTDVQVNGRDNNAAIFNNGGHISLNANGVGNNLKLRNN